MAYDGRPAARDRRFVHYVLGKTYERRERAWQATSRELVDYVQEKTSFVFGEKTGFGIVRLSYTYAVIRWDKEIFWKEIDPKDFSSVVEDAKNSNRFADVTVLPIAISEEVQRLDQEQRNALIASVRQAMGVLKMRQGDVADQLQMPSCSTWTVSRWLTQHEVSDKRNAAMDVAMQSWLREREAAVREAAAAGFVSVLLGGFVLGGGCGVPLRSPPHPQRYTINPTFVDKREGDIYQKN